MRSRGQVELEESIRLLDVVRFGRRSPLAHGDLRESVSVHVDEGRAVRPIRESGVANARLLGRGEVDLGALVPEPGQPARRLGAHEELVELPSVRIPVVHGRAIPDVDIGGAVAVDVAHLASHHAAVADERDHPGFRSHVLESVPVQVHEDRVARRVGATRDLPTIPAHEHHEVLPPVVVEVGHGGIERLPGTRQVLSRW